MIYQLLGGNGAKTTAPICLVVGKRLTKNNKPAKVGNRVLIIFNQNIL
jgi:hypothetical protein